MNNTFISDSIRYIGVDDTTLDLFEGQYDIPDGVSYNSYIILDEKIAVMDTVDGRKTEEWLHNLEAALADRTPDYLVISHLEPDHAASIGIFAEKYPSATLVLNAKSKSMLTQFFAIANLEDRCLVVAEGQELTLGSHILKFFMAPMVHWPEVMVEYEVSEKVLFSADGFGTFGANSSDVSWDKDAGRYYFNIVGKYGIPVQTLLKKAATLEVATICPLHGPVLNENLGYYIDKYSIWSSYKAETDSILVAYASIHGNTKKVALELVDNLKTSTSKEIIPIDLTRDSMSRAVEYAFKAGTLVLAASSYDGGVFPPMEDFLNRLSHKAFQNRRVGFIENGSWAPSATKAMKAILEGSKNIAYLENEVTIKSTLDDASKEKLALLKDEILM